MSGKGFLITVGILAMAVPLMATPQSLKKALNLTPDQVRELRTIVQSNKAQRQTIAEERRQKAQTLRDLTAQSDPNPTDVGNAVLALKQARTQAQTMRQQTLEKFKSDLTADQVKTLEALQAKKRKG